MPPILREGNGNRQADAAREDARGLFRDLQTTPGGLTQTEAGKRLVAYGPNEVAEEKVRGWHIRLLKILRNPLVVLLTILSAVSFSRCRSSAAGRAFRSRLRRYR